MSSTGARMEAFNKEMELTELERGSGGSTGETPGVPIGDATPEQWLEHVLRAYKKDDWTQLHVSERKDSLYFLYDTKDRPRFVEVTKYVLNKYQQSEIEDLEGISLLPLLPTPLALRVVRFHCTSVLTLSHVPNLMKTGISPQKLEKLLRASEEANQMKKRKRGVLSPQLGRLPSITENRCEPCESEANREFGEVRIRLQSDGGGVRGNKGVIRSDGGKRWSGVIQSDGGGIQCDGGGIRSDGGGIRSDGGGIRCDRGGIRSDGGGIRSDGGGACPDSDDTKLLSLRLQTYQSRPAITCEDVKNFVKSVLEEENRKNYKNLDSYFQRMLSLCEGRVNFNKCFSHHATLMHTLAEFGLTESVREVVRQGYCNMLSKIEKDRPNTWPLLYAIQNDHWSTVKVILESLSVGQRLSQVRALRDTIDFKEILGKLTCRLSWWQRIKIKLIAQEDLHKKQEHEGRLLLLKAVLDTMVKGYEIDPTLLFEEEIDDDDDYKDFTGNGSTDEQDGNNEETLTMTERKTLFRQISESEVEELKFHPSFATIVHHKWQRGYMCFHGLLFSLYFLFIGTFTSALALAAQSVDPLSYTTSLDYVRLLLEVLSLLYILIVVFIDSIIFFHELLHHQKSSSLKAKFELLFEKILFYEILRYLSIMLLIVLRIADSPSQWWMASLAIILCGLRLFHYASVLPFMGQYVGTLILLARHDLPRLLMVFLILDFSFGTGLFFALVGSSVASGNAANFTGGVYMYWLTGGRMMIEGSVISYINDDSFNLPGRVVYWFFVFCVTVAFAAILIAQFQISFDTLSSRAGMNVILKKSQIMNRMDLFYEVFGRSFKTLCPCIRECCCCQMSSCLSKICGDSKEYNFFEGIRRKVGDKTDDMDMKDYVVYELSRKLAENDKRVQALESKIDALHDLLRKRK